MTCLVGPATCDAAIVLAPMEGLADFWLRQILTDISHYDWCVSEFVRVSGTLLPPKVFYRWCPELLNGSKTTSGTPVQVQLLGSDPQCMAENAARAAELGAPAIDLNFGCPAKTVNRHGGGAVLLDAPATVAKVVEAVRRAVPAQIPVSAKMRLGNLDQQFFLENAQGIEQAGAAWLTVHARTKCQGYRPPVFWDQIGLIREVVKLPLIANGDIWTPHDAVQCQREAKTAHLMLGRVAVSDPFLANRLRGKDRQAAWPETLPWVQRYIELLDQTGTDTQVSGRIKQWFNYLRRLEPEAEALYRQMVKLRQPQAMLRLLTDLPSDAA